MAENSSVTNIPSDLRSHTSIQSIEDGIPFITRHTQETSIRHCNTARGKRFCQKLIDAAKKSSHPLLTPSTSTSLSPSPGIYSDDEALTDLSSCLSTPQRNEYELNQNFRNMTLPSLQMDLMTGTSITSSHSIALGVTTRRDKRLESQPTHSDTVSLPVKPKRRKLKQQKTLSWQLDGSATLKTSIAHESSPESQQKAQQHGHEDGRQYDEQPCRRSSRAASQRAKTKISSLSNTGSTRIVNKKPPITLGRPDCDKVSSLRSTLYQKDSDNYVGDDIFGDDAHDICGGRRRRQQAQGVVELRLAQLMYTHDNLDLGGYSILPKKTTPPVYIELDDDDDDNDNDHDHDVGLPYHSSENQNNYIDLTLPSRSSSSSPSPKSPGHNSGQPSSVVEKDKANLAHKNPAIMGTDDVSKLVLSPSTSTDTIQHLDDAQWDSLQTDPGYSRMASMQTNTFATALSTPPQKDSINLPPTTDCSTKNDAATVSLLPTESSTCNLLMATITTSLSSNSNVENVTSSSHNVGPNKLIPTTEMNTDLPEQPTDMYFEKVSDGSGQSVRSKGIPLSEHDDNKKGNQVSSNEALATTTTTIPSSTPASSPSSSMSSNTNSINNQS